MSVSLLLQLEFFPSAHQSDVYEFAAFATGVFLIILGGAIVSLLIEYAWIVGRDWWKRRKGNEP